MQINISKYAVLYEDPDNPEEPVKILIPSPDWIDDAKNGRLPPIWMYWKEEQIGLNTIVDTFDHDTEKLITQCIEPLTEEEAIEYLIMKDVPRRVWAKEHNRPMFKIIKLDQLPKMREFRNAWRLAS